MIKRGTPRSPVFWALLAASTAAVAGAGAALAVIWVYGRPRALLERPRARRQEAGGSIDPGLIGYAPGGFPGRDGRGEG